MRMWMVDPRILCRKHLAGEKVELLMFLGTFKRKLNIPGYVKNNLVEPLSILDRYDELVTEFNRRGMNNNVELDFELCLLNYLKPEWRNYEVNIVNALDDLIRRCPICAARYQVIIETDWIPVLDYDVVQLTGGIEYNRKYHLEGIRP